MTRFTLEDATLELHKPTESVKMLVQYNTASKCPINHANLLAEVGQPA